MLYLVPSLVNSLPAIGGSLNLVSSFRVDQAFTVSNDFKTQKAYPLKSKKNNQGT